MVGDHLVGMIVSGMAMDETVKHALHAAKSRHVTVGTAVAAGVTSAHTKTNNEE